MFGVSIWSSISCVWWSTETKKLRHSNWKQRSGSYSSVAPIALWIRQNLTGLGRALGVSAEPWQKDVTQFEPKDCFRQFTGDGPDITTVLLPPGEILRTIVQHTQSFFPTLICARCCAGFGTDPAQLGAPRVRPRPLESGAEFERLS